MTDFQNTCSLSLEGDPYQQGLKQGQILSKAIGSNALLAAKLTEKIRRTDRYQCFVRDNSNYLKEKFPELYEEMRGISEGSGVSFDRIEELNIPAYFLTERFPQECSMILARGSATEDGKTYVIKNRDMRTPMAQVMVRRSYSDGLVVSEITGIGTVTYPASGINNRGLGVTTTGFWSSKVVPDMENAGNSQIFLNIHLLLRTCSTVDEALEAIRGMSVMNGLNMVLTDHKKACVVEMTADGMEIEWDQGEGLLYRTNHYVSPSLAKLNPDRNEYPSTFMRRERIGVLLNQCRGHIRFQDLMRILSDHENGINGLCRHPLGEVRAQTVSTTLFVLEDGEIWSTLQNPCQAIPHSSVL
jgi:predicted choloylglycine hydrolase